MSKEVLDELKSILAHQKVTLEKMVGIEAVLAVLEQKVDELELLILTEVEFDPEEEPS